MDSKFATMLLLVFCLSTVIPAYADEAEDRLAVLNEDGVEVFKVNDEGAVFMDSILLANGARAVGEAPMVLKQAAWNRGIIIADNEQKNRKKISIGWNVGASLDYMEILAVQEGVAFKNIVIAPSGGNVGIGTTTPDFLIDTGGAYCNGRSWVDASSRQYKQEIKALTRNEAMDALKGLNPVKFRFKKSPDESRVGFIAEDVPDLVAMKDRKGMSSMDVVAVLTKVVQEQQRTVQEQRETIAELSRRLVVVERGVTRQGHR